MTKKQIANLILLQVEALREVEKDEFPDKVNRTITLANEIHRDALELAKIVEKEAA